MRRWFNEHQGTIVAIASVIGVLLTAVGVVVAVNSTGDSGSEDNHGVTDGTSSQTTLDPTTQTTPTTTDTTETTPLPPAAVGLTELNDDEDVEDSFDADFSTRNINGETHNDAVTGLVYGDDSGFTSLAIETKRRFGTATFTVGIDAEAECPRARARVSLTDERGRPLWGPKVVTIDQPQAEQALAIPRPIQVNLVQKSLVTGENACGNGEAQVSWGSVAFTPAQG